ncbi:MAG: methyl-accepting chemotaxis protein [Candidatus Goldiibacteriota bacterium]
MKLQSVFVLCGAVIFAASSFFALIFLFRYDTDVVFLFWFLYIHAAVIFLITALFLVKFHRDSVRAAREMIKKEDDSPGEFIEKDPEIHMLVDDVILEKRKLQRGVRLQAGDIDGYTEKLREMLDQIEKTAYENSAMSDKARLLKEYLGGVDGIFDKIKTIGMEIKNTSKGIDTATYNVLKDARQQSKLASGGVKAIGREIQNITELKENIIHSTSLINELVEMSKRIKIFVVKIADMAKKTNMLALNAGIEAARAGEAGKSFSVVAGEIKTLSGASNQSAEEIAVILKEIQERTTEVIDIIKTAEKIEENIRTFYQTGDIFIEIVKDVKKVEKTITGIKDFTDEHNTDSELMFKIISDNAAKSVAQIKNLDAINSISGELSKVNYEAREMTENLMASFVRLKEKLNEEEHDGK